MSGIIPGRYHYTNIGRINFRILDEEAEAEEIIDKVQKEIPYGVQEFHISCGKEYDSFRVEVEYVKP